MKPETSPELKAAAEAWADRAINALEDLKPIDLYIIKSHILIEYELNSCLETVTRSRVSVAECNFTFQHKISIAKMLGVFDHVPDEEKFLIVLNKLRNQMAHKLSHNTDMFGELLAIARKYQIQFIPESDPKNARATLAFFISYIVAGFETAAKRIKLEITLDTLKNIDSK